MRSIKSFRVPLWITKHFPLQQKDISSAVGDICKTESYCSEASLSQLARQSFYHLQFIWNERDLETLDEIMHPSFQDDWKKQLEDLRAKGLRSERTKARVLEVSVIHRTRDGGDSRDTFTACLDAVTTETLRKETDSSILEVRELKLQELWTFVFHEGRWLLSRTQEATSWKQFVKAPLQGEDGSSEIELKKSA